MLRLIFLIASIPIIFNSVLSQNLYFPEDNLEVWEKASPAENAWSPEKLELLSSYLDSSDSKAFILLQDGKIITEKYYNGFDKDSVHYWASAGKTLNALLVGIGIDQGLFSLDTPISDILGAEWTSCNEAEERKRTIEHILSMTTSFDESYNWDCPSPECLQCIDEPGERWSYHQGAYNTLLGILEASYEKNANLIVNSEISSKTGIYGAFIKLGNNRIFFSKPRAFAAFGLLMLAEGDWNNQTILKDKDYLTSMISPSQKLNNSYGYLTWLNGQESYMLPLDRTIYQGQIAPKLPPNTYAGLGANGQIVCVIPEWNVVYIRMGDMPESDYAPVNYFADIGEMLYEARLGSSVEGTTGELSPITIDNGWALSGSELEMQLYDISGRRITMGKKIKLIDGVNFIIADKKLYKILHY